MQNTLHWRVR